MLAVNDFYNRRFGFVVNARNNLILTGILEIVEFDLKWQKIRRKTAAEKMARAH